MALHLLEKEERCFNLDVEVKMSKAAFQVSSKPMLQLVLKLD
jgi:hypothetical protein